MEKVSKRTVKKKILIIQLRRVGDVIFTLPVIGALRRHFPDAQIDFLVEKPADQAVRLHPDLNETLIYEAARPWAWLRTIRARQYDWVLDFHANGRTLLLSLASGAPLRAAFAGPLTRRLAYTHRVISSNSKYLPEQKLDILRALGVPCDNWTWGLKIPANERTWAENFLSDSGLKSGEALVGLAPATRRPIRAWKEERFAQVAERLIAESKKILFLWGPGEESLVERIRSMIKTRTPGKIIVPPAVPLLQLAALIERCEVVLAVDNGPKNMAVALNVPTVTLSGPTNPLSFDPHNHPRHAVIREDALACISCGLNRCPYGHECMEHITADRAFQGLKAVLV